MQSRVSDEREGEEHQVCTLLYCLAEEAGDMFTPINITNQSKIKLDDVLGKLKNFLECQRRPYIVFRNRFWYGFMFVYMLYI